MPMRDEARFERSFDRLRLLQEAYSIPVRDISKQAPTQALHSLREAAEAAPANYRDYLDEAVNCYEHAAYRGAVLMVWSATIEHLYSAVADHLGGLKAFEQANHARFGQSNQYRKITKKDDLLYLNDKNFVQVCQDAGVFNKNARDLLKERLKLRNRCGHPTGYVVGREETVVFIESLVNNIVAGSMLNW